MSAIDLSLIRVSVCALCIEADGALSDAPLPIKTVRDGRSEPNSFLASLGEQKTNTLPERNVGYKSRLDSRAESVLEGDQQ
jgi:hypothetical protein